jgi:hypothetical protein
MTKIKRMIFDRPYIVAGIIFLAMAIIGEGLYDWWQDELELLLILYFIAIVGIRLDEISRKLGSISAAAKPDLEENGTVIAKLNEIAHSLKVLNHYLAKLTAAQQKQAPRPAAKNNPQQKLPTGDKDATS